MNVYARAILSTERGKGAIFIRHFMEYLIEQAEPVNLREAQEFGMKAVEKFDTAITVNYVKTCGRTLQEAELITYIRKGKNYLVEITDAGEHWIRNIPETYGVELADNNRGATPTTADPSAMLEVEEKPNRRFKAGQEIERHVWKAYWAAYRAGDLDIVFVEKDKKIKLVRKG